ncbi:MAG: hypothetical protein ACYDDF_02910 [Thermoplasmatota archaeon]
MFAVRGKSVTIRKHAYEGMLGERDEITEEDVVGVLESPARDDGTSAWRRVGKRTIIVRYRETPERIIILSVSATRRRLPP